MCVCVCVFVCLHVSPRGPHMGLEGTSGEGPRTQGSSPAPGRREPALGQRSHAGSQVCRRSPVISKSCLASALRRDSSFSRETRVDETDSPLRRGRRRPRPASGLASCESHRAPGCLHSSFGGKQIGPRKVGQLAAKRHFLLVSGAPLRALPTAPHSALPRSELPAAPLLSSLLPALSSFWPPAPFSPLFSLHRHPLLLPLSASDTSGISTRIQSICCLSKQITCLF